MAYDDDTLVDAPSGDRPRFTMTVRPDKATRSISPDEIAQRLRQRGFSEAGAAGIVQNIKRESGFDPTKPGDGGTSYGLFQHHNERKTALEKFAKDAGKEASDPDVQIDFADHEMKTQYPKLRAQLAAETDPAKAEEAFRRVFERPKATGGYDSDPVVGTDQFKFSDYAMKQHAGKSGTDVVYMRPQDYLDLSPEFEGNPLEDRSAISLRQSAKRGEQIEAIPTLDLAVAGGSGKVTAQDGRHRALFAKEAGLDMIPVAVKRTGTKGPVTEIEGESGTILPYDFQSVPGPPPEPDGAFMSAAKGAASGFGKTVLAGQQLVGEGLKAAGATNVGGAIADDARRGVANLSAEMAPDEAAHPWTAGAGDLAGSMAVPLGAVNKAVKGVTTLARIGKSALGGSIAAILNPVTEGDFWWEKAKQGGVGAAVGGVLGAAGASVGAAIAPKFRKPADLLMKEGVDLTPGQMAGGVTKRGEDALRSVPLLGSAIASGQRRSIETFNRAAINRALAPIGDQLPAGMLAGHAAIDTAATKLGDAYDKLLPKLHAALDPGLKADIVNVATLARNLPDAEKAQIQRIIKDEIVGRFTGGGVATGQTAKEIESELGQIAASSARSDSYDVRRLGGAVKELQASVRRMVERVNPTHQGELQAINAGWANLLRVQQAAASVGAKDGVFTPAQLLNATKALDASRRKAGFAKGKALMQDLADAGKDVLPPSLPDSGTAERGMWAMLGGGVAGGTALHNPFIPLGAAAAAAPYTKAGMSLSNAIMQRLARPPSPPRNALAELFRQGPAVVAPAMGVATQRPPGQ